MAMIMKKNSSSNPFPSSVLSFIGVSRTFDGVKAIADLTFNISEGEITSLIGPNGSGKTTAFNAISGFCTEGQGRILFKDKDITRSDPATIARLGIGRTFQDIRIFPQMPVLDNVMLGFNDMKHETITSSIMQTQAMFDSERLKIERACTLLDSAGLTLKQNDLAETLSYGQRKLLELCRIQAFDPELYLIDEPMAGLFPAMITKMIDIIKILRDTGKTIVIIEHNLKVVMEISDRILVLNNGRLIADGSPDKIKNNQDVIDVYFGRKTHHDS